MRFKLTIFVLVILMGGCRQISELTKAKPVEIDGLGLLCEVGKRELKYDELVKVVKTVTKEKFAADEDVRAMFEIYKRQTGEFYDAATIYLRSEKEIDAIDVEKYLTTLLRHENLRAEVQAVTFDESEKQLESKIEFADENSVYFGNNAGTFIKVFTDAYKTAVNDDKVWEEKAHDIYIWKKVILLKAFEAAATAEVSNANSTKEEKDKAGQFLKDLRDFNEQLPDDEKILDANGRLINATNAASDRLENFQNAVNGTVNSSMKDPAKAKLPVSRLQKAMGGTAKSMGIDAK